MTRFLALLVCILLLSSCKRDYTCTCWLNGGSAVYQFHHTTYAEALSECDRYVQGDTCEIPQRK